MPDEPTCGKGLAASSELTARLADLTGSMADILERHLPALDLDDERSRREHELYGQLVSEHRACAAALTALGERMAGARDLPMGRHDTAAMADPRMADAFERFVGLEESLQQFLESRLGPDRAMLSAMRDAGDWAS